MTDRTPSQTANAAALLRAAHQLLDSTPRVLDDPVVLRMIGADGERFIRDEAATFQTPRNRGMRAHVVVRSRYAEDRLAAAVERGITQFVLLGAGYDTFAYRQPGWARDLHVVEVDEPAIQKAKRERLALVGVDVPSNVTFASVDFEREALPDALARNGVKLDERAFFSWLGVTIYLTEPAVDAVLGAVVAFPAGSEIVLTFAQPPEPPVAGAPSDGQPSFAEMAARVGEPWQTYFTLDAMERKLRDFGFGSVHFLSPQESQQRYFEGRADGLAAPRRTGVVSATR